MKMKKTLILAAIAAMLTMLGACDLPSPVYTQGVQTESPNGGCDPETNEGCPDANMYCAPVDPDTYASEVPVYGLCAYGCTQKSAMFDGRRQVEDSCKRNGDSLMCYKEGNADTGFCVDDPNAGNTTTDGDQATDGDTNDERPDLNCNAGWTPVECEYSLSALQAAWLGSFSWSLPNSSWTGAHNLTLYQVNGRWWFGACIDPTQAVNHFVWVDVSKGTWAATEGGNQWVAESAAPLQCWVNNNAVTLGAFTHGRGTQVPL